MASPSGVKPEYIDPATGLIRSLRGASDEDTAYIKQLVESGWTDNMTPNDIKAEHGRFKRFLNKCLSDKIGQLIGPGGKNIRTIQEETGTVIEVNDEGIVTIAGPT